MKVYRIDVNADEYQLLLPTSNSDAVYNMLDFDGKSKESNWEPIEFYIDNPLAKKGNFFALSNGAAFACDEMAIRKLPTFLGFGSELLPIYLEDGTKLFIVNVTDCVNALDQDKTQFDHYEDGSKGRVLNFVFHSYRFSESSIFKIPETANIHVLTYSGVKSPVDEFYNAYNESGLEGLAFELLYSE